MLGGAKGIKLPGVWNQDGYGAGDKRGKDRRDAGRPKTPIINSCPDSIKRRPEEATGFWYLRLFCQSSWKERSPGAPGSHRGPPATDHWCLVHSVRLQKSAARLNWGHTCVQLRNLDLHRRALACKTMVCKTQRTHQRILELFTKPHILASSEYVRSPGQKAGN